MAPSLAPGGLIDPNAYVWPLDGTAFISLESSVLWNGTVYTAIFLGGNGDVYTYSSPDNVGWAGVDTGVNILPDGGPPFPTYYADFCADQSAIIYTTGGGGLLAGAAVRLASEAWAIEHFWTSVLYAPIYAQSILRRSDGSYILIVSAILVSTGNWITLAVPFSSGTFGAEIVLADGMAVMADVAPDDTIYYLYQDNSTQDIFGCLLSASNVVGTPTDLSLIAPGQIFVENGQMGFASGKVYVPITCVFLGFGFPAPVTAVYDGSIWTVGTNTIDPWSLTIPAVDEPSTQYLTFCSFGSYMCAMYCAIDPTTSITWTRFGYALLSSDLTDPVSWIWTTLYQAPLNHNLGTPTEAGIFRLSTPNGALVAMSEYGAALWSTGFPQSAGGNYWDGAVVTLAGNSFG